MKIYGESGEKTFACVDCKGKKSYHAIRCRECHYKWAKDNPNLHYTKVDLTEEFRNKLRKQVAEIKKDPQVVKYLMKRSKFKLQRRSILF